MFKLFECSGINIYIGIISLRGTESAGSDQRIQDSIRFFPAGNVAGPGEVQSETPSPTVAAGPWRRHFAAGACAVASAAAIAVVLIPESPGIRFGGSFDFMVSCLGSG